MKAANWAGVRRARRAEEWGKNKYAGSWAEYLWQRLDAVDFMNKPIGTAFGIMAFFIAIGVVIILGAAVGLMWQDRGLSWAAVRKLRWAS